MKRIVVLTVGKTHSGKTTFAKALEKRLPNSVVVDQDNHAEFLQTHYPLLLPKKGANRIKYALTQTIVDYTVQETDCHVILCNSNRSGEERRKLLDYYTSQNFTAILVYFDIPDLVLEERIKNSERDLSILRTASTFREVLAQQQNDQAAAPCKEEARHLFIIRNPDEVGRVILEITEISAAFQ